MKKIILLAALSAFFVDVYAQQVISIPPEPNENWELLSEACKAMEPARLKAERRTDQYLKDLEEYKKGLFCNECKRSASQVERELHISFAQHIKDGGPKRHPVPATQEMYANLYREYKRDWDPLYKQYQDQVKACTETRIRAQKEQEQKTNAYHDKLKELDDRMETIRTRANALTDGDKSKIEALEDEYDQLGDETNDILNKASGTRQLTADDVRNIDQKMSRMRSIRTELDTEVGRVESDNEEALARQKEKEKEDKQDAGSGKDTSSSASYAYTPSAHDLEMQARAGAQRERDRNEDQTMGAIAGATAAGMAAIMWQNMDNENEDDNTDFYLKGNLGLGFISVPVNDNMVYNGSTNKTIPTTTSPFTANASLLFSAFNDRLFRVAVSPYARYGLNALDAGTSGHHFFYGGELAVGIGGNLRLLLKGIYEKRKGSQTEDDAGLGIDATGSVDYNYATVKYGPALYYSFGSHDCFVELSGYRENLSFLREVKGTAVYSYQLKVSFVALAFDFQYAPNYPIAGELKNPSGYKKEKKSLFMMTLSTPITIVSQ